MSTDSSSAPKSQSSLELKEIFFEIVWIVTLSLAPAKMVSSNVVDGATHVHVYESKVYQKLCIYEAMIECTTVATLRIILLLLPPSRRRQMWLRNNYHVMSAKGNRFVIMNHKTISRSAQKLSLTCLAKVREGKSKLEVFPFPSINVLRQCINLTFSSQRKSIKNVIEINPSQGERGNKRR